MSRISKVSIAMELFVLAAPGMSLVCRCSMDIFVSGSLKVGGADED